MIALAVVLFIFVIGIAVGVLADMYVQKGND